MGDGSLEEMPGTIQLVHVAQVRPALPGTLKTEVAVKITVGLLRLSDGPDDISDCADQFGV